MHKLNLNPVSRGPWMANPAKPYEYGHSVKKYGNTYVWTAPAPSGYPVPDVSNKNFWFMISQKGLPGVVQLAEGLVTTPVITAPSSALVGSEITVSASDSVSTFGQDYAVAHYEFEFTKQVTGVPTLVVEEGSQITFAPVGAHGGVSVVRVRAVDTLNNKSAWATKQILLVSNYAPSVAGLTCDLPTFVQAGKQAVLTISGAVDSEADAITYRIINVIGGNFATVEGIEDTTNYTPASVGLLFGFDIVAVDANGGISAPVTFAATINQAPSTVDVVVDLPEEVVGGRAYTVTASGAVDGDGNPMTYSFTNGVNCAINDNIITVDHNVTSIHFDVAVQDNRGGVALPRTITRPVNNVPDNSFTVSTMPALVQAGSLVSVALSGATDLEGDHVLYRITDVVNCSFSKMTGIAPVEDILLTVGTSGLTMGFTVVAYDTDAGDSAAKTFTATVNYPPLAANVLSTMPSKVNEGSVTVLTFSGSDANADTLSFEITAFSNVTLSKTTGIAAGESITMTAATDVGTASVTVVCHDGNGGSSSPKVFNTVVNRKPVISGVTSNIPALPIPGTAYTVSFTTATDIDGDVVKYAISAISGCTFSKTSDISAGENTTFTADVVSGYQFTLTGTDSNQMQSNTKSFNGSINQAPDVSGVSVNYPGSMQRNGSYNLAFAGATNDDGAVTYDIISVAGGTASVNNTASAFTLTVSPTASSVSITVRVKDTNNLYSGNKTLTFSGTLTYATGDVTTSAGSTQAITINPGFAGTVTVIGNGGGGTAAVAAVAGTTCPADGRSYFAAGTYLGGPIGVNGVYYPDSFTYAGSTAPASGCYYVNCNISEGTGHYCWGGAASGGTAAVAGTAGAASTVSGAISTSFSGATTGVVAAPGAETRYFNLSAGSTHNLSVYAAPSGGSVRVLW